jgi:hypothetical protein
MGKRGVVMVVVVANGYNVWRMVAVAMETATLVLVVSVVTMGTCSSGY